MEMFQHADVVGCIPLCLYQMPLNCSLLKNKLNEFHNKLKKNKNKKQGDWHWMVPVTTVAEAMLCVTIALSF